MATSFVTIDGPMMIADRPTAGRDGLLRFPVIAQCETRKAITSVTVLDEMSFDVVYNNWKRKKLLPGALVELRGFLIVKGGTRIINADNLRV